VASNLNTAPTHVLQPGPASVGRPTSLIRGIRGQASGGNQLNEATDDNHHVALPQRHAQRHSTGPAGMLMQPWNPGPIKTGAPYMRKPPGKAPGQPPGVFCCPARNG